MYSKAESYVRDARTGLLMTHPFFGVLSLELELVETREIPTFCVNSTTLKFNPDFALSLSRAELKGVIGHEVFHLALCHHARQGARDGGLWNEAGDYAINGLLIAEGFTLPKGALIDQRYSGMAAEAIYTKLWDERQQNQSKPQDGKQKADNAPSQPGDGQPQPCGTFEKAGPAGSAQAGDAERDWQEKAARAARVASSAGKLPAGLKRLIEESLAPNAQWESILRRFMTDKVKQESSWSRRNRRFQDICMPGRVPVGMGDIVILIDTSGSVSQPALARFSSESASIFGDVEPANVHVVYCDTDVHNVESFAHGDEFKLACKGGGGTRFQPAFDQIEREGWTPACVLYFTDLGASDFPSDDLPYPVLWAVYDNPQGIAPCGETIHIQ